MTCALPWEDDVSDRPSAAEAPRARRPLIDRISEQAPIVVLILVCLVTALLQPRFLSTINLTNVLLQASVLGVIVIGMTYVIIAGGFDLSVGSVAALSGCVGTAVMVALVPGEAVFDGPHSQAMVIGMGAGVLAGLMVGILNGVLVAYVGLNPFIATLGTMVLVRGLVLLGTDANPITGEFGLPESFITFGRARFLGLPWITWVPLVLLVVLGWVLHRTRHGLRIFAVGGGPEAAFLAGVNVRRVKAGAFALCGALAGLAGVMLAARLQSGQPTAGTFYELFAIAAVILGGASLYGGEGRLWRSMIGLMIIVVLSNSLNILNVVSHWQEIALGLVIIAAASIDRLRSRRT
jgi:ribose transport system permease protein